MTRYLRLGVIPGVVDGQWPMQAEFLLTCRPEMLWCDCVYMIQAPPTLAVGKVFNISQ